MSECAYTFEEVDTTETIYPIQTQDGEILVILTDCTRLTAMRIVRLLNEDANHQ